MHTRGVLAHLDIIERVTGRRPPTCPWRAFYHPLVREVLEYSWSVEKGNLDAALGPDPAAILVEAIGTWERAVIHTRGEDRAIAKAKAERDAKMAR